MLTWLDRSLYLALHLVGSIVVLLCVVTIVLVLSLTHPFGALGGLLLDWAKRQTFHRDVKVTNYELDELSRAPAEALFWLSMFFVGVVAHLLLLFATLGSIWNKTAFYVTAWVEDRCPLHEEREAYRWSVAVPALWHRLLSRFHRHLLSVPNTRREKHAGSGTEAE